MLKKRSYRENQIIIVSFVEVSMIFDIIYAIVSSAVFLAALIFIGVKLKEEVENFYPLFVFLYYFFGSFKLNLFLIPIPLGFIICLIYISNREGVKNKKAKKSILVLALIAFILSSAVPFSHSQMLARPRILKVSSWSADRFRFTDEYKMVLKSLGTEASNGGTPAINSFQVDLDKNNVMTGFEYYLSFYGNTYQSADVQQVNNELYVYPTLKTQTNNSMFPIVGQTDLSPAANAEMFFDTLDNLTLDKLKYQDVDKNEFTLSKTLAYTYNPTKPAEVYIIDGNSLKLIKDEGQTGNILSCIGTTTNNATITAKAKSFLPFY
jgi:hypothetical protein